MRSFCIGSQLAATVKSEKTGMQKAFWIANKYGKSLTTLIIIQKDLDGSQVGVRVSFFFYRLNALKKGLERFAPFPFCVTLVSGLFRRCVCVRMSDFKGLRICCCWFLVGKRLFIPRSHAYFSYFFVLNYSVLSFGVGFG